MAPAATASARSASASSVVSAAAMIPGPTTVATGKPVPGASAAKRRGREGGKVRRHGAGRPVEPARDLARGQARRLGGHEEANVVEAPGLARAESASMRPG